MDNHEKIGPVYVLGFIGVGFIGVSMVINSLICLAIGLILMAIFTFILKHNKEI